MESVNSQLAMPAVPSPWGETWVDRVLLTLDTTRFLVKWVVIRRGGDVLRRPIDAVLQSLA